MSNVSQLTEELERAEALPADTVFRKALAIMDVDPGAAAAMFMLSARKATSLAVECCERLNAEMKKLP